MPNLRNQLAQHQPLSAPPSSLAVERMQRLARDHADPKVRGYAQLWLEARGITAEPEREGGQ